MNPFPMEEWYRERITRMYRRYCPEKLGNVDQIMVTRSHMLDETLQQIVAKYGPEVDPPTPPPEAYQEEACSMGEKVVSVVVPPKSAVQPQPQGNRTGRHISAYFAAKSSATTARKAKSPSPPAAHTQREVPPLPEDRYPQAPTQGNGNSNTNTTSVPLSSTSSTVQNTNNVVVVPPLQFTASPQQQSHPTTPQSMVSTPNVTTLQAPPPPPLSPPSERRDVQPLQQQQQQQPTPLPEGPPTSR
eukprot:PhF_6_TR27393/c0_g1_i4/m.40324